MFSFLKEKKNKILKKAGFTIIEMLVVAAIFAILTAIIIFNYGNFTDNILATNMAYEIGLVARQAQVFGLGVRGTGGEFTNAYGIFVNLEDGSSAEGTKNIIFFVDNKPTDGNGECNDESGDSFCTCSTTDGLTDECLERLTLQRGIIINGLFVKDEGGDCVSTNRLAVTFKRPNPDAIIVDQADHNIGFELAEMQLFAPRSQSPRYVIVRNTGQISVDNQSVCN